MEKQVVVAKFREDMGWLKHVPWPTVVYDKDPSVGRHNFRHVTYVEIPNHKTGREAHTYACHIVHNYRTLPNLTFFLQGKPFDHHPHIFPYMYLEPSETTPISHINVRGFYEAKRGFADDFPHLNTFYRPSPTPTSFFYNRTANPWRDARWKSLFATAPPLEWCVYGYGAQFVVPRRRIWQRPLGFYTKLLNRLEVHGHPDYINAWFMETMWLYVFGDLHRGGFPDKLLGMPPRCMA